MLVVALLVLLFVSADMINPLTPGAFAFEPDDSLDMSRSGERHWNERGAARETDAARHPVEPALAAPRVAHTTALDSPLPPPREGRVVRTAVAATADASGRAPDPDH
jgi:hypothetical protein